MSADAPRTGAPEALRAAATRVMSELAPFASPGTEDVVRNEVDLLVARVVGVLGGEEPHPLPPGQVDRLRLLRLLRSELVSHWDPSDSILPTLRALEAVQDAVLSWGQGANVPELLDPYSRNLLREVLHLLRSPMGSIVMLADTLGAERAGPLTDTQKHQLSIIHRAALGLAATAGDVLTLTSEDDGLRASEFGLPELIRSVAEVGRPVTEARSTSLTLATPDSRSMTGPADAVRRVLTGVAIRAAVGIRDGHLELGACPEEADLVRFWVAAEGVSVGFEVDRDSYPPVFLVEPDTARYEISADDMGLAAARKLVGAMGSTLEVEPAGGDRARLSFRLALPAQGAQ